MIEEWELLSESRRATKNTERIGHDRWIHDTSFLLSILFEDDNYERSADCWNGLSAMVSSVVLDVESRINIYKIVRRCEVGQTELSAQKQKQLNEILESIHRKHVDEEIVIEVNNHDQLKRARSLDAIHLATANIMKKLTDEDIPLVPFHRLLATTDE